MRQQPSKPRSGMPPVAVKPDTFVVSGGMNVVVPPMLAKPGTARLAYNYEYGAKGGVERLRGIEPFDGHPAPSAAIYALVGCSAPVVGVAIGDTLTGVTSAVTGVVVYVSGANIGMTRVSGTFVAEVLNKAGSPVATITELDVAVDGFLDNQISKAAADNYQVDITKVPGAGQLRGLAILNDVIYAWRNNVGLSAMAIYKSSAAGWVAVPLYYELSFTVGATQPAEGATITQGGTTATVKRVVLESGAYGSTTAAGRYIITAPAGGVFAAGALAAGAGTVPAAGAGVYIGSQIALAPSGRVVTHAYSFTSSLATRRLYGCDGVNREFEFDGDVLAPITTGMGSIRATTVRCHKNFLFYGYRGSLQKSGVATPYIWSAVFGAAEFSTGDTITNLISVGGNTDAAALMVLCQNAIFMLYGSSTATFDMQPLSNKSGAQRYSAQDIGGVVALDNPGVMSYPATQYFGNYAWDTISMEIQPIARDQTCSCSVFVSGFFKYRIFFGDGTAISGLPVKGKPYQWSIIDYGKNILFAEHEEIAGVARTFYGDDDGWVYEADVGRSFAGSTITRALKLHPLSQRSPAVEKTYRQLLLEIQAESAATFYTSGEFNEDQGQSQQTATRQYGAGLTWDLTNYDASYWDVAAVSQKTAPMEGTGTSCGVTIFGEADNELSHTLFAGTLLYTPRKIAR